MTERNEKVLKPAREYVSKWLAKRGGLSRVTEEDLALLIHNSLLAGWDDSPLHWNDETATLQRYYYEGDEVGNPTPFVEAYSPEEALLQIREKWGSRFRDRIAYVYTYEPYTEVWVNPDPPEEWKMRPSSEEERLASLRLEAAAWGPDTPPASLWTQTGPDEYHMVYSGEEYWVYIDPPSGWWAADRQTPTMPRTQLWRAETKEQLLGTLWVSAVVKNLAWEDAPPEWTRTPEES